MSGLRAVGKNGRIPDPVELLTAIPFGRHSRDSPPSLELGSPGDLCLVENPALKELARFRPLQASSNRVHYSDPRANTPAKKANPIGDM